MNVYFHLPDIVFHYRLHCVLEETMKQHPEYFYDGVKIGSVYGCFPGAMWNGGRFYGGKQTDDKTMHMYIDNYNERGIPVRFTFTNPLIQKEHLGNSYCNRMLRAASNGSGLNEVIINSPILEEYIRENYPQLKFTSSTCKEIRDADAVNAELEKDYKLVVLDYNWNNNFEFLESIKRKDKCELLINACCIPNCPRRGEHYRAIGQQQIDYEKSLTAPGVTKFHEIPFECEYQKKTLYEHFQYPTNIRPEALYNKYVPMGYNQFKIEGRSGQDVTILENYVYYMIKPEHQRFARLRMLEWLTDKVRHFM